MAKYIYPAIFTKEDEGGYSILFPDLQGCYTQGEEMQDSLEMANDVLCFTLYDLEIENAEIPPPSDPSTIKCDENSFITLVSCDTIEYRRFFDNKAVKKTLTIPSWLNKMAEQADLNFSQILQNALKEKLLI